MGKIKDSYQLDPFKRIPDVWILDSSFQKLGLIDDYTSLIWSRRYYEVGDFELYVRITEKTMKLFDVDLSSQVRFIMRADTKEVMRIEKIEMSVNAEEGDFITASGRDLRSVVYQRCNAIDTQYGTLIESPITGGTLNYDSVKIVDVIYDLVNINIYNPKTSLSSGETISAPERKIPYFSIGSKPSISNATTSAMQVDAGINVGEKIEELCKDFKIGWKTEWNGSNIVFQCYVGADRTDEVIFSEEFANLISFTNSEDLEEFYNVMILYNEYESEAGDVRNDVVMFGEASGFTRFEKGFDGATDMDVPETSVLRDLLYSFKLPSEYNLHWYSYEFDHSEGPSSDDATDYYKFTMHSASEGNPDDEYRTGNSYMSSSGQLIITHFRYWADSIFDVDDNWEINVGFKSYDFMIYSDQWLEELQDTFGNKGYIRTQNGIRYYHVDYTMGDDVRELLSFGRGLIEDNYGLAKDYGVFEHPWGLTIPAEYSSDGKEHSFTIDTETMVSNPAQVIEQNLVPFSFELTLNSIFLRDRYMAKAYSMVEEALSTNDFEGEIAPDVNYEYRKDYDIGDKIRIKTDIGLEKDVRITEAVETFDSDGYNIEVKFGV